MNKKKKYTKINKKKEGEEEKVEKNIVLGEKDLN